MFGYVTIVVVVIQAVVKEWPTSLLIGRQHKLVIPAVATGKKVLLFFIIQMI